MMPHIREVRIPMRRWRSTIVMRLRLDMHYTHLASYNLFWPEPWDTSHLSEGDKLFRRGRV